jgi:hypothetical protein
MRRRWKDWMPAMQARQSDRVCVSEVKDEIGCGSELRVSAASIGGGVVPGMFETQLRANQYGASDQLGEAQRVL